MLRKFGAPASSHARLITAEDVIEPCSLQDKEEKDEKEVIENESTTEHKD